MRIVTIIGALLALLIGGAAHAAPAGKNTRPNIVLLLADDAGYADFGFQGSRDMKTPNIDRLAASGTIFEQAYVAHPTCGPSRAALLTGKYPQRFGYEHNNVPGLMSPNGKLVDDDMGLPLSQVTMARRLRDLGYRTGLIGKWHQGNADQYHPLRRGFDEFYGFRGGARSYFAYTETNQPRFRSDLMERGFGQMEEPSRYVTDAFGDEAISFMQRNRKEPFFLMVSFTAVHTPMHALPEDLAQFPGMTGKRQQQAAMMLSLDRTVGAIVTELDRLGMAKNTIVVFTNDNGGPTGANASHNYPLAGAKATYLDGGVRVPMAIRWPARLKSGSRYALPVSLMDLLPSFVEAAGGNPKDLGKIDGVSLWPYLAGTDGGRPHQTLFWKRDVRATIREGDWKLLRFPDRPAELYDLSVDPSEQADLAAQHPERVRDMFRKLFAWETTLERPLWMLDRKYDAQDLEDHDRYRVPSQTPPYSRGGDGH